MAVGIVRPARRPPGWRAPGPAPAAAGPGPGAGEDLCYLAGDWRIFQRLGGHRWSLDDLVTAWFAIESVPSAPPRVLDLGCGIGAVLLMLAWRFPAALLVGVEAQGVSARLARRSIAWNGVDRRCRIVEGDLRDPAPLAGEPRFDLITGTPPYLAPGAAVPSGRLQWGPCHFEYRGGVEAYVAAAARHLAPHGTVVTCAAAAHGPRVARAAAAAGLAAIASRAVVPRAGKPPLFAVWALRAAPATPPCRPDPPLVVRDRTGARTAAFRAVRHVLGMPP
jgi:tRNA1Val (adenine37-N6)-methyltransferase